MYKFNCLDDIPTAEQFRHVLNRMRYRRLFAATLCSTAAAVAVAAATAVLLSWFLLPVIRVTGTSMEPLLSNGQIVLCNKLIAPERGDVIAMYYNKKVLLKRVIAVAGDVVEMDGSEHVLLNGEILPEPYVREFAAGECDIEFPYTVKENRWFVMGDNRAVSIDSRASAFGCAADENILGVVRFRIYPFDLPHWLGESK